MILEVGGRVIVYELIDELSELGFIVLFGDWWLISFKFKNLWLL